MPKVNVLSMSGEVVGDVELNENIFNIEINESAVHSAIVNQLANKRQGTQSTKTKSEVRGGGAKPWRQKGTGRARQGSIRSAQWIKGGVVFAPKPRDYSYKIPKKIRRLALKSVLSSIVLEEKLLVIDDIKTDEIKTKKMVEFLNNIDTHSAVVVLEGSNENVERSMKNIPGIKTLKYNTINTYDLLKYDKLVVSKEALNKIEEVYV